MRRLLAHRDSRIYLTGQLFSLLGDSSLWLAMGIWVRTLTGSNTQAGLVVFFFTAPALLAPALGLLADRVRRRPLLIATNALMAVAVLSLLTVHDRGQVWVIDAVMLCYGISAVIIDPAQSALLTIMVPDDLLPDANGALRTVQEAMKLVGPLAGAGVYVAVGAHVIAVADAITFVFPVMSLLLLRVEEPAPQPEQGNWRAQLTAGVRHIWQTIDLRRATIAGICTTAVFGFGATIVYAIATTGLHRGPAFVGVLASVQGAGAVAGGLSAAMLVRRLGESRVIGTAMLVAAAGALLQIPPLLPVVLIGEVVFGSSIPCLVVGLITLMQRQTPPNIQGRVFAAAETLITTPQTLSIAVGAALIGVAGYRVLLAAMAIAMAGAASYMLTRTVVPAPRLSVSHGDQPPALCCWCATGIGGKAVRGAVSVDCAGRHRGHPVRADHPGGGGQRIRQVDAAACGGGRVAALARPGLRPAAHRVRARALPRRVRVLRPRLPDPYGQGPRAARRTGPHQDRRVAGPARCGEIRERAAAHAVQGDVPEGRHRPGAAGTARVAGAR